MLFRSYIATDKFAWKAVTELVHGMEDKPGEAKALLASLKPDADPVAWVNSTLLLPWSFSVCASPIRASFSGLLKNIAKTQLFNDFITTVSLGDMEYSALALNAIGDGLGTLVLHNWTGIPPLTYQGRPMWQVVINSQGKELVLETIDTFCRKAPRLNII